jgi:hypothetical protein
MPGAMGSPAGLPIVTMDPFQAPSSAFGPSYFGGDASPDRISAPSQFLVDGSSPPVDRNAVLQHAADAIQRGADPNAVRARLIQMGLGDQEPPSPFADLMSGRRPGTTGDSPPPPAPAQPAFNDQGGFAPRAASRGYAQDRLGNQPQRLDPRLAPQKAGGLQKTSRQRGGVGAPGSTILSTYGLPSFPSESWARGGNEPNPAIHAFPLPNDHPLPKPSHVEGDDIVVTGPRPATRETMRQIAQHSSELREVGRFIGSGEGNYESYNTGTWRVPGGRVGYSDMHPPSGTVTGRTINEILSTSSLPGTDRRRLFAVGKYQITFPRLRGAVSALGLTGNERMTPELQDRIFAEYLVPTAHNGALGRYIFEGRGTVDDAQYAAAREWASIALPAGRLTESGRRSDGRMTYYDKGSANSANVSATNALRTYLMNLHR